MLTVLFVLVILFAAGKVLSMLDGQHVSSAEVGSYLHYEYNIDATAHNSIAQLSNI